MDYISIVISFWIANPIELSFGINPGSLPLFQICNLEVNRSRIYNPIDNSQRFLEPETGCIHKNA